MSRTISAKVSDELLERIDQAREGEPPDRESRSAAIKRLIRTGLEAEDRDPHTVTLPIVIMWLGTIAMAAQYVDTAGLLGPIGGAAFVLGFILTRESAYQKVQDFFGAD